MPVMSLSSGASFGSHGASVSGWRFVFALIAVSIDAVGCQNARSGLSPVATFVCTPCSYGSGIVTTSTSAPVACSNADTTCAGTVLLFCAAHTVSFTPANDDVGSGQPAGPSEEAFVPGSLQAATPSRSVAV